MKTKSLRFLVVLLVLFCVLATVLTSCKDDKKDELPDAGAEAGVYWFMPDTGDEYLLTLGGKSVYSLTLDGKTESGNYTLDGEKLTLTYGENERSATYGESEIVLDIDGAKVRFLKRITYTVSFDSLGGSSVADVKVTNGKALAKPADPTRDGYVFLGWYSDAEYKVPFLFDATPVTSNLTLRARWAALSADSHEYRIDFDLGYGAANPSATYTVGGKLWNAPVPTRDGYKFLGWWVSSRNEAGKLTYRFTEGTETSGTVFSADTTLFAVWQSASAAYDVPALSVVDGVASWDRVNKVNAYLVTVTAPDGTVVVDAQRVTGTSLSLAQYLTVAGDYTVEVTAVDAGGNALSDTAVRTYTHRGLDRVGGFTVIDPSVLTFRGVAGATKYYITVECGNELHVHEMFDNGGALYFNFANCEMKKGGIVFTVTATADGYASSTAKFTYERNLGAVTGLTTSGDSLTWNTVDGATTYFVTVDGETYTVLGTSFSLSALADGEHVFSVVAVAHGYNSSDAAELSLTKKTPALPENIRLVGTLLTWDEVPGATSYELKLGDTVLALVDGDLSYDLAGVTEFTEGAEYALTFKVNGAAGSAEKVFSLRYNALSSLDYAAGRLTWSDVIGAEYYEVRMNGETFETVTGVSHLDIATFTKSGVNTLAVRFFNGDYFSEWSEISVTAHKVVLDGRGGNYTETLYKAVGDPIDLPALTRVGYDFSAWYNLPGGAEANGRKYSDAYYVESGETVLYAYYTPKEYRIIYSNDGNTDKTGTVRYGRDYKLDVPEAPSATMAFGGWYSAPYGSGIAYTDAYGNSLAPWSYTDDDITVYAFWVDMTLRYDRTASGYAVSAGSRISLVSSVTIPAEFNGLPVTEIVSGAFGDCDTLVEIRLPDTLTRVAETAFSGCTNLRAITVYESGEEKSPRYSSADGVLFDSGLSGDRHAPRPVLMPMAKTGAYTVPDGVDIIPRSAFAGSKLSKIVIPTSVREIGTEAFADCTLLTSVVFENAGLVSSSASLTIGDRAFLNCTALETIALPARLTSISLRSYVVSDGNLAFTDTQSAFEGCENLYGISVAKSTGATYTSEDGVLFGNKGTELLFFPRAKSADDYEIPAGVTKIGEGAFSGVKLPATLELPGRIISVGAAAFANCTSLTGVVFKAGLADVTVGDYAFYATNIYNFTFEEGSRVTAIGNGAFKMTSDYKNQYKDKDITLPASLKSVGNEAFSGLGESVTVVIADSETTLTFGNNVFSGCEIDSLELPANADVSTNFFAGMTVSSLTVSEDNPRLVTIEGVLYTKKADGTPDVLLFYPKLRNDEFAVPDGVTAIADGAFRGEDWMEELTLPASLTSVGREAFRGMECLKTVTFNGTSGTLTIGAYAFYEVGDLETVEFKDGLNVVIGEYAFAETEDLTNLSLGSATVIGAHAFENAAAYSFVTLTIPETLVSIGDYAFRGACLEEIIFPETSALRTIGGYAFADVGLSGTLTVPASVTEIYAYAFGGNYFDTVEFEDGDSALSIGLPITIKGYDEIPEDVYGYVFYGDTSLSFIDLPARLTKIYANTFRNLSNLKYVTFGSDENPSKLTTIGEYAFYQTGLTSLTIPASVRNTDTEIAIGAYAFASTWISSLTFELGGSATTAPLTIGESAFEDIRATEVTLPARLAYFTDANGNVTAPFANGRNTFSDRVTSFVISGDEGSVSAYTSFDGVIYNSDMTELIFCPAGITGKVTVPKSVKKIADYAFNECQNLTAIEFEEESALEEIGYWSFRFCVSLGSIALPDSVHTIGEGAFMRCDSLTEFTIPASLKDFSQSIIEACGALRSLNVSAENKNYTSVDGVLFSADGKTLLLYLATRGDTSYTVPAGTEIIYAGAFSANKSLRSVTIPASVKLIDKNAFQSCSNLSSVTFEDGKEPLVISDYAFSATSLTEVVIPARVRSINLYAFSSCGSLATITFADGSLLSYIGTQAFSGTAISSITLPAALREMGDSVFLNCSRLVSATLNEGLLTAGARIFVGCTALESVSLPSTLKTLGDAAFSGCAALKSVSFAKNSVIETLGLETFRNCSSLESITLPASLTAIPGSEDSGKGFFAGCTSLHSVIFEEGSKLTEIGAYAFEYVKIESITLPGSLSTIGDSAFYGTDLVTITLPNTVTSLGVSVFNGSRKLTSVTLGSGIRELPMLTFAGCESLTSFTVPASVTTVSDSAFAYCDNLEFLYVDSANESMHEKYGVIFDADWNIVIFPAKRHELTIPKDMKAIPKNFFEDHEITSITVEEGNTAFVAIANVLYNAAMDEILFMPDGMTSYEIPAAFLTTPEKASKLFEVLAGVSSLTDITLADGVTDYRVAFGAVYTAGWELVFFPMGRTEFVIPKEVTELNAVSSIGTYNFFAGSALKTVSYEERDPGTGLSINRYGSSYSVFRNADKLETLSLPEGTTYIARYTFSGCTSLRVVNLPSTLATIEKNDNLFSACSSLEEVNVASGNTAYVSIDGILFKASDMSILSFPRAKTTFVIPASLTSLPSLSKATGLVSITYEVDADGNEVKGTGLTLADDAFKGLTKLRTVALPSHTKNFSASIVDGCTSLESVTFAPGAVNFRSDANGIVYVKNSTGFTLTFVPAKARFDSFEIPAYVTLIEADLFENTGVKTVTFAPRDGLALTLEAGVAGKTYDYYIGKYVYFNKGVFYNCTSLTSVSLPEGTKVLGDGAFYGCTSLNSLTLPSTVTEIGKKVFGGCTSLNSVTFAPGTENCRIDANGVVYVKNSTGFTLASILANAKFDSFEIPADVTIIKAGLFENTGVKTVTFAPRDGRALTLEAGDEGSEYVNYPVYGYVYFNIGVFYNCTSLTSVSLPEGTDVLGAGAFYGCTSLKSLVLPSTVTEIGKRAFGGCTALESVTLNEGLKKIGDSAFVDCEALKSITLPSTLTEMGEFVFEKCTSITELTLPASLTKVGAGLFKGWTKDQTVKLTFKEGEAPVGFDADWAKRYDSAGPTFSYMA